MFWLVFSLVLPPKLRDCRGIAPSPGPGIYVLAALAAIETKANPIYARETVQLTKN